MKTSTRTSFVLLCTVLLACTAQAEQMNMPQRWLVTTYEVEPGMQLQHAALARRYVEAAREVGWETPWFTAASIASATPSFTVAIPVASMGQMMGDDTNPVIEAEGPEAMTEILAIASETYEAVSTIMVVERDDLGVEPPAFEGWSAGYWSIRVRVAPGDTAAFETYLRAIVQASDGQYWSQFQGGFGAPNTYIATIPIREWSQMDQPPGPSIAARLRTEFGNRRGQQIYDEGSALIQEMDTSPMRWMPELSWVPGAED